MKLSQCAAPEALKFRSLLLAAVFGWAAWMASAAVAQEPAPTQQEPAKEPTKESTQPPAPEAAAKSAKEAEESHYPPLTEKRFYEVLLADIALQRQEPVLAARTFLRLAEDTQSVWFAQRATESALAARDKTLLDQALALWQKFEPESDRPQRIKAQVAQVWQHPVGKTADESEARARLEELLKEATANDTLGEAFLQLNSAFAKWSDKVTVFNIVRALALPYPQQPEAHYAVALAALMVTIDKAVGQQSEALSKILQEGVQEIDLALEDVPQWDEALQIKAALLEKSAPEQLLPWLQECIKKMPDEKSLWPLLARAYVQKKHYSEAREWFLKIWKDDGSENALMAAGALSMKMEDHVSAQGLIDEVEKSGDEKTKDETKDQANDKANEKGNEKINDKVNAMRVMYGRIAEEENRPMEAIEWYRKVNGGDNWWNVQIHLAALLAQNGKRDDALALLKTVSAETVDEKIGVLQLRARILREADDWIGAYAVLAKGVETFSESVDLLMDLGLVEEKLGKLKEAEQHLRAALKLKPDEAFVQNALGYTLVDHQINIEEGAALIEKALASMPDDGAILDSMGWARYRQGRTEEAVHYLQQAWEKQPDPEVAAHWGEVLWQLGRFDEARQAWAKGLEKAPNDTTIQATMKRLNVPSVGAPAAITTPTPKAP
ncbi:MAG: tetratricopeptide repeat protein [Betaproteobacteria bacterium]|nr:tetratricopeptide repeat protein [Betaproteobacteria bacterium]